MKNNGKIVWSAPYHGITHAGKFSTKTPWVTVVEHSWGAELKRWFPGCGFSPRKSDHKNTAAAKKAGERWLKAEGRQ